jgi:hypothetical protein
MAAPGRGEELLLYSGCDRTSVFGLKGFRIGYKHALIGCDNVFAELQIVSPLGEFFRHKAGGIELQPSRLWISVQLAPPLHSFLIMGGDGLFGSMI